MHGRHRVSERQRQTTVDAPHAVADVSTSRHTSHVYRTDIGWRRVAFPIGFPGGWGGSFPGGSGFTFLREYRQWATFTASSPFLCVTQSHFYRFSFYRNHTVELARAVSATPPSMVTVIPVLGGPECVCALCVSQQQHPQFTVLYCTLCVQVYLDKKPVNFGPHFLVNESETR